MASLTALCVDGGAGLDAANYLCGVAPGLPFLLLAVSYRGIISFQPDVKRLTAVAAATVAVKALLARVGYAWLSRHSISARGGLLLCGVTASATFIAMAAAAWLTRCRSMAQSTLAMTPHATIHDTRRIFSRGLTIGLTAALQAGFFSLVAFVCGACSPVDLAAHQGRQSMHVAATDARVRDVAMSQAAATLASRALGAQSGRMALRVGWEAVYFAIAVMFVIAGVLLALGHVAIAAIRTECAGHACAAGPAKHSTLFPHVAESILAGPTRSRIRK